MDDLDIQEIKSWKEFERELAQFGEDIRNQIEMECEAFATDPAASQARRARAWNDYQFFCQTYFPHYVPTPHFSLFQQFVFKRLPEIIDGDADGREVHQAPRGEVKSTYETQLGSVWCIVTGRKHMIGIIMNTEEQAAEMLESIKAELDTNPRLAMDFPEACGRGRVWQATTAITANNVKVRIGGTGKKIRGMKHGPYRPDLIFLDDLENDEQVKQKAQRDKTEKYVLSAVLGLAPPGGGMDVFWVGTSLHYDAAINRVSRAPGWRRRVFRSIMSWPDKLALWEQWEAIYTRGGDDDEKAAAEDEALAFYQANKAAMEAGAECSWPDVRPLYRLMCMRAVNHDSFSQEQQNEAGNDETAPFKTLHFWVDRLADWVFFGALDPSLGKQSASRDPSALLVGGLNRATMVLDVVEADICRRVPDLIISRAIDLQAEYNCVAWAVETVQFQAFLFTELIKRAALLGVAFPAVPVVPLTDKNLRIISLQPHIVNALIRLHRSQTTLIEQLKFWPEADHDDGPDALDMLRTIATQFGGEWEYTSAASSRNQQRSTSRRSSSRNKEGWDDD
ncbi:phage terminase large subunit [Methylobacter sp.]|uniref:phage terminase large subunit n=1 Tax=Methylobacter sp. TaxID=2051955 RepID=UPI002486D333|nr:phage terminase large subunit [Methylobacter sp.]MDI1276828.1 phage terminase large subunit [Methylobacter sp.]MDI1357494.1 phage terminase large subunit [Methylobacter sp.]